MARDRRDLHDHYFRQAKREGYLSRAAYKLIEIDDRKKLLRRGDRVLDCGCAPGSWLQVAAKRVGPRGRVVGIDLQPCAASARSSNVTILQGDLREVDPEKLLEIAGGRFDVVLSDMAPSTSGDRTIDHHQSIRLCEAVLDLSGAVLRPGGKLAMKVFEGEAYPELLQRMRGMFERVKGFKPPASRSVSTEMYVIAEGMTTSAEA
jgi:23S rRNA (uridine2552-2'-O)-methyltransferase